MGYARYVGRVGGLAVGLGIGAAVAGLGGIACADDTAGTATNSDSGHAAESAGASDTGVKADPTAVTDTGTGSTASPTARRNGAGRDLPRATVRSSWCGSLSATRRSALHRPAPKAEAPARQVFCCRPFTAAKSGARLGVASTARLMNLDLKVLGGEWIKSTTGRSLNNTTGRAIMSSMSSQNFASGGLDEGNRAGRKPRADGVESRRAILLAAANLATTRGLESLSIGELAQHIGMSKSGLYAHFKSKEELELATIETAAEIFERDVLGPAGESPGGLGRVLALSEAFFGHLERRVFPGGCFIATVSVQLAARPGRPRDRIMELQERWLAQFAEALGQAVAGGELPRDTDIGQLVFEITAMLVRANFTWILTGDTRVLDQARVGIRHVLEGIEGHAGREGRSSKKRAPRDCSRSRA